MMKAIYGPPPVETPPEEANTIVEPPEAVPDEPTPPEEPEMMRAIDGPPPVSDPPKIATPKASPGPAHQPEHPSASDEEPPAKP